MPPNIFFTADTHFGHGSIIPHCNRPFASIEEMDAIMVANWNAQVKPQDVVWHLGDFAWRNHLGYLNQLNGHINLVVGNHDKMSAYVRKEFEAVYDLYHGRITGLNGSPKFFLFHYPMVTWPHKTWEVCHDPDTGEKRERMGTLHLYGHTHGRYDRWGDGAIDVGVDCRNFTLFPFDEVVSIIETKVKTPSHNPCFGKQKEEQNANDTPPYEIGTSAPPTG